MLASNLGPFCLLNTGITDKSHHDSSACIIFTSFHSWWRNQGATMWCGGSWLLRITLGLRCLPFFSTCPSSHCWHWLSSVPYCSQNISSPLGRPLLPWCSYHNHENDARVCNFVPSCFQMLISNFHTLCGYFWLGIMLETLKVSVSSPFTIPLLSYFYS